jgi:glycosyltransferase involved in cell wall biosynthesis
MRKILIVLPNDSLGGAEQVLKMIARNFKESQVEVRFLKRKQADGWNDISSQVCLSYQDANSEYLGMFFFVCSFLFRPAKKYDYIFTSHVLVTGIVGILIRLGLIKKKYFVGRESTQIFSRFSGFKLFLYKKMYQLGYSNIDLLICQTEQMKQSLLANLPWIDKRIKVKVIANPIDLSQIDKIEDMDYERPFIVSAGRLISEKGFDILIDAFKKITDNYPAYQLIILGEGKERLYLENKIRALQLENKVQLSGYVSDVYSYFKKAKLCVVSSRIEGFPNVLLQMMSQNNKVVSTKCAGEIDKIPGIFIANTHDVLSLFYTMETALNQDTEKNRLLFDVFLRERTIERFLEKIEKELCQG